MEAGSPGLLLFLLVFAVLFALCVAAITFVPAYILWRKTKDKRFPLMWVTCSALIIAIAAVQTFGRRDFVLRPQPIDEPLSGVVDKSGALRVTALRMPAPEQRQVRIEVDAENAGSGPQLLGIQCTTGSGVLAAGAAAQTTSHHIWTVDPNWKGTLTCDMTLPGISYDGVVTVVLARCVSGTPGGDNWLPADSEAIYQNRFNLLAPESAGQSHLRAQ